MLILAPPAIVHGLGQTPAQVQSMIQTAAAGYNVPDLAEVATAVAQHESGFLPTAQNSSSSAAGIFQLISATQNSMGVTDPYNAQQNVNAGVSLLAQFYNQYGNWPDALQAFSDGQGTVASGAAPSAQTQNLIAYVQSNTGLDFSADNSGIDLSSLGIDLPDLTGGFSISDALGFNGVPDWVTWAGLGLAVFTVVQIVQA